VAIFGSNRSNVSVRFNVAHVKRTAAQSVVTRPTYIF